MTRTRHAHRARTSGWAAVFAWVVLIAGGASAQGLRAQAVPIDADEARSERVGDDLPVRRVVLENGMRLLVLPRPGMPTVSFVMQFGVGGVNETPGTTGIAHLLEHMLFKGSETIGTTDVDAERALFRSMDALHDELLAAEQVGDEARVAELSAEIDALEDRARAHVVPNEYDRILTRAGARGLNAMTTSESTTYFVELPANRAELFFALESDRMSKPVFREFYSERDVVMEERRMRVDTSPAGALYEAHLRAAFTRHPYGQPVVGTMADLRSLRRSDVADYYRRFYGPRNAVLAVVGSVDPQRIEEWAQSYFGSIPAGERPAPVRVVEPPQTAERRVEVEWDARPSLRIGWHVPAASHDDGPALAVLSALLTGGRTSRLHRALVTQDRLATSVYSSMGPGSLHPRLFQIDAVPIHPHSTQEIETEIYAHIEVLIEEGPTEAEVERVRNQIEAGAVRRIQSNLGLAFQLADSESLWGDWRETFRASARLRAVTPADVRRVVATYLVADNRTVATLVSRATP
jgi:predicted Zn-dependent peptidase